MEEITDQMLFNLYNDTLSKCGTYLYDANNDIIEYSIYEDFDIGVHSFLHLDNLNKLNRVGLISIDKLSKSILLRDKFIKLQNSSDWGIENFKISEKWKEIMMLCDELKVMK